MTLIAFSEYNNEQFDKKSIIIFGDFGQLLPILNLSMYVSTKWNALSNSNLAIYKQFKETYKFDIIQYQSGNSREQQEFRNIF